VHPTVAGESSFDRRPESPAGAAGLFQLTPDTAKRFGLSLWPLDQRFQTEPSATAAAQYLRYLFDRFQNWRLALAAYNAGAGAVQKLADRCKTRSYGGIAGHLPADTQMYVPRGSKPSSCSVKARSWNSFPCRKCESGGRTFSPILTGRHMQLGPLGLTTRAAPNGIGLPHHLNQRD
jgi:hypothetical protein